jgi:hypothetical protein
MVSTLAGVPPALRSRYLARAVVAGVGVAHPPSVTQDELWQGYFARHYAGVGGGLAKRIFANAGVQTRHAVVNPLFEDPSGWPTSTRMRRYLTEALPLGKGAVAAALEQAGVAAPAPVTPHLAWTSCSRVTWAYPRTPVGCSSDTWDAMRRSLVWGSRRTTWHCTIGRPSCSA